MRQKHEMPVVGCWATVPGGFRCMETLGCETSLDYGYVFEHCYQHLGELLAAAEEER